MLKDYGKEIMHNETTNKILALLERANTVINEKITSGENPESISIITKFNNDDILDICYGRGSDIISSIFSVLLQDEHISRIVLIKFAEDLIKKCQVN
jgi:hypothetical protein